MNKMKTALLAGLLMILAGCDNEPPKPVIPEVNDANCQMAKIMKIEDRATREEFAGRCSRRAVGGGIAPTEKPMNWLELAAPQGKEAKQ